MRTSVPYDNITHMIPDGLAAIIQSSGNVAAIRKDRANMRAWYYQLEDRTIAYAELTGEHGQRVVGDRGRVYFIISGEGEFVVNDATLSVHQASVVPVPAHATYNFHSTGAAELTFVVFLDEKLNVDMIPSK